MNPSRQELEKAARRALSEVKDPRKAAGLAAAGTAAAAGIGLKRFRSRADGAGFDSSAYRLLPGEPVGAGVKRVLGAQVDDAISQLRGEAGTEAAEAIHEARKDVKKIRSALRLVRHEIGDDVWRRENEHYREVARGLSGFRDAEILVEALDGVTERFGEAAEGRFDALREQLEKENRAAHDDGSIERAMAECAAGLTAGRGRIDELALDGEGWELIGPGLHRTYRRGRKRLRTVEEDASVTNLHELRKRVKDLWYQVRLIGDADKHLLGTTGGPCARPLRSPRRRSRPRAAPRDRAAAPSGLRRPRPQAPPARADRSAPRRAPVRRDLTRRAHLRRQAQALHEAPREALGGAGGSASRSPPRLSQPSGRPRLLFRNGKEADMKVFVAGATGAIGKQLVPMLVEGGHEVTGMTRTAAKTDLISSLGAQPAVADALDPEAVAQAVAESEPEVVIHELTAIDLSSFSRSIDKQFAETNRLRTEGIDHLLAAAKATGARRFIAQSFAGWPYKRVGGPVKSEEDPLDDLRRSPFARPWARSATSRARSRGPRESRASPCATAASTVPVPRSLWTRPVSRRRDGSEAPLSDRRQRRRRLVARPYPGCRGGDVAAIDQGAPGVYNVVDDDPAPVAVFLPELAKASARSPRAICRAGSGGWPAGRRR